LDDDGIVVAIDVGVHAVEALEDLSEKSWESAWERDAYN